VAVGTGHVQGRTLTFSKPSSDDSGKCDAPDTGAPGARVYGVLFEVPDSERHALRAAEKGYKETEVGAVRGSETIPAFTYVAQKSGTGLQPYHWYKALVIAGAHEHGLPEEYIQAIRHVTSKPDPDPHHRVTEESILIAHLLQRSIERGSAVAVNEEDEEALHFNRSREFVEALAEGLRLAFPESSSVRVFSKHYGKNRTRFGVNELKYDVLMCDTGTSRAATKSSELTFITRAYWAVESEFARNARQSMYDFNKLILSSSEAKLFIGPLFRGSDPTALLRPLRAAAHHCSGEVLVALLPHPSLWQRGIPQPIRLWRWHRDHGDWAEQVPRART
jgi:hypothetical protein